MNIDPLNNSSFEDLIANVITKGSVNDVDKRVGTFVKENNLIKNFLDWAPTHENWLKGHLSLANMLSPNIQDLEKIISKVWIQNYKNVFKSFTHKDKDSLVREFNGALQSNNKILIFWIVYRCCASPTFFDPSLIQFGLSKLSEEEQMALATMANEKSGLSLVQFSIMTQNIQLFDLLSKRIPVEKRTEALNQGKSAALNLGIYSRNKDLLKKVIEAYPENERVSNFKQLLDHTPEILESGNLNEHALKTILASLPNDEERIKLLQHNSGMILKYAIENNFTNMVLNILRSVQPENRKQIMEIRDEENNPPLHIAAQNSHDLMNKMLNEIPDNDRPDLLQLTGQYGRTLLSYLSDEDLDLAKSVLSSLKGNPSDNVKKLDETGWNPLQHAVFRSDIQIFRLYFSTLSMKEREEMMDRVDPMKNTIMFYAVSSQELEFNRVLVDLLPSSYHVEMAEMTEELMKKYPQESRYIYDAVIPLISQSVPHLLPPFKIKEVGINQNKEIYFLAKKTEYLGEKLKLLGEYTSKVDPEVKFNLKDHKIEQINLESDLKEGYTVAIAIHDILPRPVRALYGTQDMFPNRNCHGAAMMAMGLVPFLQHIEDPVTVEYLRSKTHEVPLDQISTGDWVYLSEGPQGTAFEGEEGKHSFIFLSPDFCLSMNGAGQTLQFYLTKDVLKEYGFPENALNPPSSDKPKEEWRDFVKVFRKNPNWTYPKEQMKPFDKVYNIDPEDEDFPNVDEEGEDSDSMELT